jgi:integrase
MHSKRAPRGVKNAPQRSNSKGVRNLPDRPGRPNPFGVEWSEREWDAELGREARRVKRQFFPTAELRDSRASSLRKARREGSLRTMSRREVDEWAAFQTAIAGASWQDVVAGWRAHLEAGGEVVSPVTVEDFAKTYLANIEAKADRGELAAGTATQRRHKIGLFRLTHGAVRLADIKDRDVRAWLDSHKLTEAGTRNNYLKILRTFFTAAKDAKLVTANPCEPVRPWKEHKKEVGILTVPQLAHLLDTAVTFTDADGSKPYAITIRRLALEAFAGIRFGSALRLKPEDVKREDRGILHPAESIKTKRRQYVEGFPENLWAWLDIAPDDSELTDRQYMELKSTLFHVARVPHPRNCLRHGFATYHLASRSNPGQTALLLCHRNQGQLWDHYKGNATAADGRKWETITPTTAREMGQSWRAELAQRAGDPPQPPRIR